MSINHTVPEIPKQRALHIVPAHALPPVQCEPWCYQGRGHTDAGHPEDQSCFSELGNDEIRNAKGDGIGVYAARIGGGSDVRADVSIEASRPSCIVLTEAELREFIAAATKVADMLAASAPKIPAQRQAPARARRAVAK